VSESVEYFRTVFRSDEWRRLLAEGWITITVNSQNIALMVRAT